MAKSLIAGLSYILGFFSPAKEVEKSLSQTAEYKTRSARGWGENIEWLTLDEGYRKAKEEKMPMMVVIHKMTCPACLHQKQWFSRSNRIESLSKDLAMVNLEVHEVPRNPEFTPDSYYVPRILFFSPYGAMLPDIKMVNGNPQYQYNYSGEIYLVNNMKLVIQKYKKS